MSEQADPRCQVTTVGEAVGNRACVWCELPAGHAGMHRAEVPNAHALEGLDGVIEWHGSTAPGVWMVAQDIPYEGITTAVPYATEVEALRAVDRRDYGADLRAYFVPFGQDLSELTKG